MKKSIQRILAYVIVVTLLIPRSIVKSETINSKIGESSNGLEINVQDESSNELTEVEKYNNFTEKSVLNEDIEYSEEVLDKLYEVIEVEESEYYHNEDLGIVDEQELKDIVINYKLLRNKTNDNYEVAFAYSDGNYEFVNSASTYYEAIEIIETTPRATSDNLILPVIINEYGQVVYSTSGVAKLTKTVNNSEHKQHLSACYVESKDSNGNVTKVLRSTHPEEIIQIYSNSSLTNAVTYINQNSVQDAPILEITDKAVRIQVNGYDGWIKKSYTENYNGMIYNWSDLVIIPSNQVTNPSYYMSEGGILYHYISKNIVAVPNSDCNKIDVGLAPSYMTSGVKYLSYDGNYFYSYSDSYNTFNTIASDLINGNKNNSINVSNPYYNYYQYLPFRSKTTYTSVQLDNYINNNTDSKSKLRGIGKILKNVEKQYGINALLILAIAINESANGMSDKAQKMNNIFGLRVIDGAASSSGNSYSSIEACIIDFSKNWMSRGYADPADSRYFGGFTGNKKNGANVKYASDPFWGEKAAKNAFKIDRYLSGGINNLNDYNAYQLGIYTSQNEVINSSDKVLYRIDSSAKVGTSFILTSTELVNINGKSLYEIYTERDTEVSTGKYHGNYNWIDKGYIDSSGVKLINTKKNIESKVEILGGNNRFDTAVQLSQSKFNKSNYVVIVNNSAIIDGVTASALATALKAPILLARNTYIDESIKNEISRLEAKNAVLVGGATVLGDGVVNDLRSCGITNIKRAGGNTRYETALEVAKYIDDNIYDVSEVFIVYGQGEADALSAGAISGQNRIPILLTRSDAINSEVKSWLSSEKLSNGYVIGGTTVISNNILNELNAITTNDVRDNRLGGATRQDTNAMIIDRFYANNLNSVYVTKSLLLVDALTAGPIAAMDGSPILIVNTELNESQKNILSNRKNNKIIQAGLGVNKNAINTLRDIFNIY